MLHVVGIRHHSPACAHLVRHVIERTRPKHVLIEGPADMNERLGELLLDHRLPIAVFTHLWSREGGERERRHASWTPFCSYSPEWIALRAGHASGADVRFCDLPAWHEAFDGRHNRYGDAGRAAVSERPTSARYVEALCRRYAVDDVDALWDHLFEGGGRSEAELDALGERLTAYFEHYRDDAPAGPRDAPREELMARYCAWALRDAGERDVVLVCGGFHAPVVRRRAEALTSSEEALTLPALERPPSADVGSYLVPYSYRRLDSFAGYDAGMPSPAFYELVHDLGPAEAGEQLLARVVERLRSKKQPASTADLVAARTLASGLAAMRGHPVLLRSDLLDGLSGALVKDGLEVPPPWARRGPLLPRTEPLLVEIVAALSGDREGRLAPSTPRPPLVDDVERQLEAHELSPTSEAREVRLALDRDAHRQKSRVLHRLALLAIPGFSRASGPAWATDAQLTETWQLRALPEATPALIEASIWGATLEAATLARLGDLLLAAGGKLARLTEVMGAAVFVGALELADELLAQIEAAMANEHALGDVGAAIAALLDVHLHGELWGARGASAIERVLVAALDRGLWLLEGRAGPQAPLDEDEVAAVASLRDLLVRGPSSAVRQRPRVDALLTRRSVDLSAPPAIRGACLGALWSLARGEESAAREGLAIEAMRAASLPERLGDFLGGLFGVARSEALHADGLLSAVDEVLAALGDHELLVALPALRLAFSYFPPRERAVIATKVLKKRGVAASASALLTLGVGPADVSEGLRVDRAADALAARFALEDALDGGGAS